MDGGARGRRRSAEVGFTAAAFGMLVVALVVVGSGVVDGREWSAPGRPASADRRAALGTGAQNESDFGNLINGSCSTRFDYREIRLRVDVPATSQQAVVVDLTNVPGASRTSVEPGTSRTWALDKGAGHCRFAGPEGTLVIDGSEQRVWTREGLTSTAFCFSNCTAIDGSVAGTEFTLKQGGRQEALPYVVVTRPEDPDSKVAQIDLRIDVVKINPPIRIGR